MSERYPEDQALLSMAEDGPTGVEYIPTGLNPYYLQFRRLVHRLLLAAGRANDLRVYQDGELSIGVRPGRCWLGGEGRAFSGVEGSAVATNATTWVWLASDGMHTSTTGLPADRTTFVPLAKVTSGAATISGMEDLRGEAFLHVPTLATLGLEVDAAKINAVLAEAGDEVTAAALNRLTGGAQSTADEDHRHLRFAQAQDTAASLRLRNDSGGPEANIGLVLDLPLKASAELELFRSLDNGYLTQRQGTTVFQMVGCVHAEVIAAGELTASQTGRLAGAVAVDGQVVDVVLSVGRNLQSSVGTDGLGATAKVNGVALATSGPTITSAAGSGHRSTALGDGTAAVLKTDGTVDVRRGDVLTVDLARTASGTVSVEAADVSVLVVIRVKQPE
ncbi:MAG: hypothetical protein IT443_01780 [Phycisphaeraceae bacterium]|nr:hypothetical protein [Phycisphaeraceae bacterium]